MKNLLVVCSLFFAAGISTSFTLPAKEIKLTVKHSFANLVDGYDHDCRTQVYIDDELAGTSTTMKESKPNSVTVPITSGQHHVRVINQALYEGDWEDHTVANDYSIDAMYEASIKVKKSLTISLLFDVDKGTQKLKK